jgi:hypothetical protein
VSHPFLVDHTPPELSLTEVSMDQGVLTVRGEASDGASPLAAVEVALDYGDWHPAFAEDGLFDFRTERFMLRLDDQPPGEHSVSVRAFDRAGNPVVVRRVVR